MEDEGGVVVRGRVEIDMRQPFRSVKEAVTLFGEKVLAGEIYANKLKEKKGNNGQPQQSKIGKEAADQLEETKQSFEKSNEEGNLMALYLHSLKQELEQTKKELQQLKGSREYEHKPPPPPSVDPEIEELKFIENRTTAKVEVKTQTEDGFELEKKRSVKFASPPLLTRVIISKDDDHHHPPHPQEEIESSPSAVEKKFKRKPLITLFGIFFPKKKGHLKSTGFPRA